MLLTLGVLPAPGASAETLPPSMIPGPDNTEAFRMAYGLGSFALVMCGDDRMADLFRQAIKARVAHCPFTETAKQEFDAYTRQSDNDIAALREQTIKLHGSLPERLEESKQTCSEHRTSPDFVGFQTLLEKFSRGDISAETVLPGGCFEAPGAL